MCCLSKQKLGWDLLNCSKQEVVILLSPSSMYHKRRRRIFGFFQVTKTQYKNTGTATSIPIYLFRMFQSERREHRNAHKPRRQKTRQHCYGESSFVIYEQISQFFQNCIYMGFVHSRVLKLLLTGSRLSTSFTCRPPCFPFSRDSGQEQPTEELVKNKRFREGVTLK